MYLYKQGYSVVVVHYHHDDHHVDVDDADDFVSPKKLKVSRESLEGKGLAKQNVYVKSKAGGKTK